VDSSDLTARARIRDAALKLFAERGIERATVRDIAQEAGVSSGLLRHHFGSKEGLRDACDEYAASEITTLQARFTTMQVLDRLDPRIMLLQNYMIRSVMDGTPAGNALFDRLLAGGEQWLEQADLKVSDPRAFVGVLGVMKISMVTMGDHLSRAIGEDARTPHGWARVLQATVELFSQPLLTPEQAEQARRALDRLTTAEE
jgi:TetR/AcrR family transcriptional regulator, regulator of cefoperazone and chloramphenicol sensitivity